MFVDPSGLEKCRLALALGHVWDIEDMIKRFAPQNNTCDIFAPLCCFMNGTKRVCVKKGLEILPDLPGDPNIQGPGGTLWCSKNEPGRQPGDSSIEEELPKLMDNLFKARDDFCDPNSTCKCQKVKFQVECNDDKKKPPLFGDCVDILVKQGLINIPFNPCGQGRKKNAGKSAFYWQCPQNGQPGYFYRTVGGQNVPINSY